jgi:hypothetical protein
MKLTYNKPKKKKKWGPKLVFSPELVVTGVSPPVLDLLFLHVPSSMLFIFVGLAYYQGKGYCVLDSL